MKNIFENLNKCIDLYLSAFLLFPGPASISVPLDSNNKHMGHGIITFREKLLANLAFEELKKTSFKDQMILYSGPANREPSEISRKHR